MILTVANMKGGVGKTTTSVILSEIAALQHGMKTLLVDMDTQRNAFKKVMNEVEEGKYEPVFDRLTSVICDAAAPNRATMTGYDLVVIDTPPRADARIIRQALDMSDVVVVPFQMGEDEITGVASLFEILPDKELYVFPILLLSPLKGSYDKGLTDDATAFFESYGLSQKEIHVWPMRVHINNNLGKRKPYHFQLTRQDKAVYNKTFDAIMKSAR